MEGDRITRAETRRPDMRYPFPPDFAARLAGQTVHAVQRRAKYLLLELSSGELVLMHLGMSGSFRVLAHGEELDKHDHVVFEMASGRRVAFNDPRRFGFVKLLPADTGVSGEATFGALGPEPLSRAFTADGLAASLRNRKSSLKAALLDQRVVAGLGNIYVVEALHRARLSPKRRASTLVTRSGQPRRELHALVAAIREVLKDAIANTHRPYGEDDRFRVYDHEGGRCPRRGCSGIIKRIVQAGRSTFFCPVCQR